MRNISFYSISLAVAAFFVTVAILMLVYALYVPDRGGRYVALLYLPSTDNATIGFQEELRFSGHKAFYACGEMGGSRILDISGDLAMSLGNRVGFTVDHVERPTSMTDCFQGSRGTLSALAAYPGETVRLLRLPSADGSICFYHYDADVVRCMSRF